MTTVNFSHHHLYCTHIRKESFNALMYRRNNCNKPISIFIWALDYHFMTDSDFDIL